jgi:hypothetical protein
MSLTIEFASGYERTINDDRCLEVFHSDSADGWWEEITFAQNPYDLDDIPAFISIPGSGKLELDDDGAWVSEFESWPIWTEEKV